MLLPVALAPPAARRLPLYSGGRDKDVLGEGAHAVVNEATGGAPAIGIVSASTSKVVDREASAFERRNWVRLTRLCNNRCTFCLDSDAQDGTMEPSDEIRERIRKGRADGATRLILSGGEPTVHPDFLEFVALGKSLGYRRIQTVTNGRMFSYGGFAKRALDAGLGEVTFSIHGHTAELHDTLVGVHGAFAQETKGIRSVLRDGRAIVNIDVVLNRRNVPQLREMLEFFLRLGVREFDLLQIIPFGRAFSEYKDDLFYDLHENFPHVQRALELKTVPGIHIWTNRFPVAHLEGHEELIQDPHKLFDEVRGREEIFEAYLSQGRELPCRSPDRCPHCYLDPYCSTFFATNERIGGERVAVLRHDCSAGTPRPEAALPTTDAIWLRAAGWQDLETSLLARFPDAAVWVELADAAGAREEIDGRRIDRIVVSRPEDVAIAVATGVREVVIELNARTAVALFESRPTAPVVLWLRGRDALSRTLENDVDLRAFFERLGPSPVPTEGIPACLAGPLAREMPRAVDLSALRGDGKIDLYGFTDAFITDAYRAKSLRCRECVHDRNCSGLPINHVRAFGFRQIEPIRAS